MGLLFSPRQGGRHIAPDTSLGGPGLVVLNTRSVVWVAMRTRLWRCSPEQLRPAFPSEVLGRELASEPGLGELLRQVVSGGQAGAVDVSRELPPREDDHLRPVVKGCLWLRPHRRVMSQLPCQPRSSNLLYLQAFFQPHMCLRLYPLGLMQKEVERCRLVSPGGRLCRSRSGT